MRIVGRFDPPLLLFSIRVPESLIRSNNSSADRENEKLPAEKKGMRTFENDGNFRFREIRN